MLDMAKKRFYAVAKRYGGVTKRAKFNRQCVERVLASVKDYVEPSPPSVKDDDDDVDAEGEEGEEGEECGDNAEDNEKGEPTLQTRDVCMDLFVFPLSLVSLVHVSAQ